MLATLVALAACEHAGPPSREAAGDSANTLSHLLALADSEYRRGENDSAHLTLENEIQRAGRLGDSVDVARGWTTLSIVDRRQGKFDDAQSLGERSVALKRRLGLNAELPRSLNALGMVGYMRGNYDEAVRRFDETRDAAAAVRDSVYVARARGNLGLAYTNMGDVDRARTEFIAFRDFAAAHGNLVDEGDALDNLGLLETRAGDPTAAVSLLESARARYAKAGSEIGEENALGQLGVAWHELGEPSRALAYFDSSLTIATKQENAEAETNDLELSAEVYDELGDHKRALELLGRAEALAGSLKMTGELGHVLLIESRAYTSLGMPGVALARATDAARRQRVADSPIDELTALLEAAALAQRLGDAGRADSALTRARTLADNLGSGVARIEFSLGAAHVADEAKRSDDVLSRLNGIGPDSVLLTAEERTERDALRARALLRRGDVAGAANAGSSAVAAIEHLRTNVGSPALRTSYTAGRAQAYSDLVVALLGLNKVDSAFRVADAARGRALVDQLGSARHELPRAGATGDLVAADSLLARINVLIERLRLADTASRSPHDRSARPISGEIARQLAAARASYDSVVERMGRADSRSAIVGASTMKVAAVKAALGPDERLVEYFDAADHLLVFVVSRQAIAYVEIPVASGEIAEQARLARELISARRSEASDPIRALYANLISPIDRRGLLAGARGLVIVPHGALTYLPFAALRESELSPFLAERFSIVTLTSASALVPLREGAAGRPRGASRVFAPLTRQLPATRQEANAVATALAIAPTLDSSASEPALREALTHSAIVHIASHGTLDVERPMFSAIATAPPAGPAPTSSNDGRLETREVLSMHVGSQLVYLSGCETALGASTPTSSRSEEDYATLAQAFLFAGARNVVATLWRIDDQGAAEFASRFYEALRSSTPTDALARAQRALIHDPRFRAPYYWAAYSVSGAGTN